MRGLMLKHGFMKQALETKAVLDGCAISYEPLPLLLASSWQLGFAVGCKFYMPEDDEWRPDDTDPAILQGPYYGGNGSFPSKQELAPVQKRICRGQYDAAKMAQVLAAGGTQARLLVAAIMAEGDPCPSTSNDLLHAYQHPNTERNFSEAARHARDFVAAADAAGVGACVTLSVVDVNNGTILLSEQVHTGRTMPTNYDTPPRQYEFEYSSSSSQDGSGASSGGLVVVVVLLAVRVAMRVALRDHEEDELGGVRRTPGDLEMGTTNQATPGRPLAAHPPLAHPPTAHYHQPLPTVDPD